MRITPYTEAGLRKFDHLSPAEAVIAAWLSDGSHPSWGKAAREETRAAMPVLAHNLDRLAQQQKEQLLTTRPRRGRRAACRCSESVRCR